MLLTKLLPYQLYQTLVEPLHVLRLGKSVSYHTFALMLPQCQQHLEIFFFLIIIITAVIQVSQYKPAGQVSVATATNSALLHKDTERVNMTKRNELFYYLMESLIEVNDYVKRFT